MSKGIVVVNIPEKREKCPLYDYEDGYCTGKCGNKKYDHIYCLGVDICCPIKPLPEKQTRDYPEYDRYITGYDDGWDACINEILGE